LTFDAGDDLEERRLLQRAIGNQISR